MFTVFVDSLEFYAYHGITEAERTVGHRYVCDLEVDVQGKADRTDRMEDTVSYVDLAQIAAVAGSEGPLTTVEHLAGRISNQILTQYSSVREVRIRLAKRLPPAEFIAESVGVELTVQR